MRKPLDYGLHHYSVDVDSVSRPGNKAAIKVAKVDFKRIHSWLDKQVMGTSVCVQYANDNYFDSVRKWWLVVLNSRLGLLF